MSTCLACRRLLASSVRPSPFGVVHSRGARNWIKPVKRKKVVAADSGPLPDVLRLFQALHPLRPDTALSLEIVPALAKSINANAVKGRTFLPHDVPRDATAVKETIAVIVEEGPEAETARRMGADFVGTEDLITQMIDGLVTPTKLLCHPSTLSLLTRNPLAARTLGPKGLMPSVRRGTVSTDIGQMIQDARGALDWATETTPADEHLVRAVVGRIGMEREKVEANVRSLVELVADSAIGKDPAKEAPGTSTTGARRGALKRAGIKEVFCTSADGYRVSIV